MSTALAFVTPDDEKYFDARSGESLGVFYHFTSQCYVGSQIPEEHRQAGSGGRVICPSCPRY